MNRVLFRLGFVFWFVLLAVAYSQSTLFRIDRVISGIRLVGTPPNVTVEDVKTTFEVPQDKEAVVYFEWSGPSGRHNFEGIWRNPDGNEAGRSSFAAESSTGKFSGNWKLFLDEKTQSGRWSIESWVDGQIVGRYGIDVRKATSSGAQKSTPAKRLPSLAEIYRKANAATGFIEHVDRDGHRDVAGSGFFVAPNTVVTSFGAIDGASGLRLFTPARSFSIAGVVAWNRLQDWAVLRTGESTSEFLTVTDSKLASGAQPCLTLSVGANRERSLADGSTGGEMSRAKTGDRLLLSFSSLSTEYDSMKDEATGSPLMNNAGQVFGFVVGPSTVVPGSAAVGVVRSHNMFEADSPFDGLKVLAVSAAYFAPSLAKADLTSLAQLATKEFASDLVNAKYIQSGTIALRSDANGNPVGQAFTFRPSAKAVEVWITWNVAEHFDGNASLRVYDENNRLVFDSRPQQTNTPGGGKWVIRVGTIPLDSFPPGTYRVDYVLNDGPAWRSFFRMIP